MTSHDEPIEQYEARSVLDDRGGFDDDNAGAHDAQIVVLVHQSSRPAREHDGHASGDETIDGCR